MLGATRTISSALSRPTRVLSPRSTRQLFTSSKNVLEKLFRLRENAGSYSDESISLKNPISSQIIQPGSVGFGFSAGGLLFPYYIGVIEELHILGVLTSESKLAGASAGSLIAACYHSGLSVDVISSACLVLAEDCRKNGTRGRLGSVLKSFLNDLLPDDIHERCTDRAYVAITTAFPTPRPELVSVFHSKSDLISALLTSCHIPWWLDNRVVTEFRGRWCYDGGLTNFIPLPPSEHRVRVCCFPAKQLKNVYGVGISPDTFRDWDVPLSQMLAWAFEPGDESVLRSMRANGRADAKAWARETGYLVDVGEGGVAGDGVTGKGDVGKGGVVFGGQSEEDNNQNGGLVEAKR